MGTNMMKNMTYVFFTPLRGSHINTDDRCAMDASDDQSTLQCIFLFELHRFVQRVAILTRMVTYVS